MLSIQIEESDYFDESLGEFISFETKVLDLEHSLASLSKWESRYRRPFLDRSEKSHQELMYYVACMVTNEDFVESDLLRLSVDNLDAINAYIESPESATTFGEMPTQRKSAGETITSELIYYWMVAFNIPFETQHWHLNRLFALIRIANIKNSPPKKLSKQEIAEQNARLNAERRAKMQTKG